METTIITWNFTNWVTVVLMVLVGFFILSLGAQLFHNARSST